MRGTPVYVVLHFRRFKNVELVKLKSLTYSSKGEEDAFKLGPLYLPGNALAKWLGLE